MKPLKLAVVLFVTMFLTIPLLAAAEESASLSVDAGFGSPGESANVQVNLGLNAGIAVSAINFDLAYDEYRLRVAGVGLSGAVPEDMHLITATPSAGTLRVILFNLKSPAAIFGHGPILDIEFEILSSAAAGTSPLELRDSVMADPSGLPVLHSSFNASFTVFPPSPTSTPTSVAGRWTPTVPGIDATPTEKAPRSTPTPVEIIPTATDNPVQGGRTPTPTGMIPSATHSPTVHAVTSTPRTRSMTTTGPTPAPGP